MKVLMSLFLVAELAAGFQGPQPPAAQAPADVVVLKQSWAKELIPGWENRGGRGPEPYDLMLERVANERRMQQARDTGNRGALNRGEREAKVIEKANGTAPVKDPTKPAERSRFGYRYKVSLRNTGAKTIKAVDWDYVFLDSGTGREIARHQFTSEEKIRPGKDKEMSVFILAPPSRTVNVSELSKKGPQPFVESVTLVRVEYSDGSVWQQP